MEKAFNLNVNFFLLIWLSQKLFLLSKRDSEGPLGTGQQTALI